VKLRLGTAVEIKLRKDIKICDAITGDEFFAKKKMKILNVKFENKRCYINDLNFQSPINVFSDTKKLIEVNGKMYFGTLKIIPGENGFDLIDIVPIETYLISVVQSEMPLDFHVEALKTQAIIARTYSYYFMKKYGYIRSFDVDNTVSYQVYNGYDKKTGYDKILKLMRVIKESRGMIIKYDDNPIMAYFHSNSGGKIISGKDYYGSTSDLPYLVAKDDPYSIDKPNGKWNFKIDIDEFKSKLNIIDDISADAIRVDDEGFVDTLKSGDVILSAKDIRRTIGYFNLKSERFIMTFDKDDNLISFDGIGFGHGVGLSQWGAEGMAEKGFKFNEIIDFYYPGTYLGFYQTSQGISH
jgi:stage II sporulation protein D